MASLFHAGSPLRVVSRPVQHGGDTGPKFGNSGQASGRPVRRSANLTDNRDFSAWDEDVPSARRKPDGGRPNEPGLDCETVRSLARPPPQGTAPFPSGW